MWFVISTLDRNGEEVVWECPANWIINNILHYPPEDKKTSKGVLLNKIKKKDEPDETWTKTSSFKYIENKEGFSSFGKQNIIHM